MRTAAWIVVAGVAIAAVGVARAQQEKLASPAMDQAKQGAMDPAMQAAMEKMKVLGAPSEGHKALEPLIGSWSYTAQFWMQPDSQPETMTGSVVNTLIFGGRFLKQEFSGTAMAEGQPPFEGLGILGFDNIRKEYQTVWFDNMSTSMMRGAGQFDASTSTLSDSGDFSCPVTGESHRWYRSAWTVTDANHTTYESYSRTPEGREFKSMEIHYTRTGTSS